MSVKHVIIDRDGVLNTEAPDGGYIRTPNEFHWVPGALEGLKRLHASRIRLSVATNQSGVGRGFMTVAELAAVHERMKAEAGEAGASLAAVYFCPHAPDENCRCRKPAPALIEQAVTESGIAASDAIVVGDDWRDLQAAWRAGVAAVLLRTGKGQKSESRARDLGVPVYNDLLTLAEAILNDTLSLRRPSILTVHQIFKEHAEVMAQAAESLPPTLTRVAAALESCLRQGNKILACGNGGSAADAQHFVAELVGRFRDERRALPALTLAADPATVTALANDYGYERVFSRQVEAHARRGDVLFAISTSGNSPNVVAAAQTARELGCLVVALTGANGGRLTQYADILIAAPSTVVARIQEVHALSIHAIADSLDELLRQAGA